MKSIIIKTNCSAAIGEWAMKEFGSWEDHNNDPNHPCALLQKFGGTITLTEDQAKSLIKSGEYHANAWDDDDIRGGKRTKKTIQRFVDKLSTLINQ